MEPVHLFNCDSPFNDAAKATAVKRANVSVKHELESCTVAVKKKTKRALFSQLQRSWKLICACLLS